MSVSFKCPQCQAGLRVPPTMAGRSVQCPKCQKAITVPAADAGTAPIAAVPMSPPPSAHPGPASFEPQPNFGPPMPPPPSYGSPMPPPPMNFSSDGRPTGGANSLAITGMVLGIVGFFVVLIPCVGWVLGIIMGIMGVVFSGIGLAAVSKLQTGKGFAITGLVTSVVTLLWVPLYFFIVVSMVTSNVQKAANQAQQNLQNLQNFQNNFPRPKRNLPPIPKGVQEKQVANLAPGGEQTLTATFKQGEEAKVWVISDFDSDVDLTVLDPNGLPVGTDFDLSKDCFVSFQPARTQEYRLVVRNNGPIANRCVVKHN